MPEMPGQVQQLIDALVSAPPLEGYLIVGAFLFAPSERRRHLYVR